MQKNPHQQSVKELKIPPSLDLPSISIVVPNYNGGATIAATLQSLIDQNYPTLEIVVVDGGSTDQSVEVIRQFESQIAWWVSEKDKGQSQAINKGFAQCSGEIVNWLCSDDLLAPGALYAVAKCFRENPDLDVVVGQGQIVFTEANIGKPNQTVNFWMALLSRFGIGVRELIENSTDVSTYIKAPTQKQLALMAVYNSIAQPSCFYHRRLLDRSNPIDEDYHYAMDTELWNYFQSQGAHWKFIDQVLSISIQDGQNKTSTGGYKITVELERIYRTYTQEWIPLTFWHRWLRYPLERFLAHNHRFWLYAIAPVWVAITLALSPFYGFRKVWAMRWRRWA